MPPAAAASTGLNEPEPEPSDAVQRARRLRSTLLGRSAALLDRDLRERGNGGDGGRPRIDGGQPPSPPPPPPPPPQPCFSHPLLGRFADAGVEAAFAVYKANTLAQNRLTLCLTLALLALSVASIAVSDVFGSSGGGGRSDAGHSAFSDIAAFAVILAVYGVRAQRLIWPKPLTRADLGLVASTQSQEESRWRRWWRAFKAQHYVALLLLLPVPVEALLGKPLLMALNLASSCVFLLVASALLLAHAVAYCAAAWYAGHTRAHDPSSHRPFPRSRV